MFLFGPKALMKEEEYCEFKRGATSAVTSVVLSYPINKLSIRQSMDAVPVNIALQKLKNEGMITLYKGIGPPLFQKTVGISFMYGMFQVQKRNVLSVWPTCPKYLSYVLAGTISGTIESVLTPFERMQTLLTCPRHAVALGNVFHGSTYVFRYFPVTEFYRGWSAIAFRNCFSTSLFFIARDIFMDLMPFERDSNLGNFITGALLGCILTTICFPINATRLQMQSELACGRGGFFKSFWALFETRNRSIRKMYIGGGVNAVRSLIFWGIAHTTHEFMVNNGVFCS